MISKRHKHESLENFVLRLIRYDPGSGIFTWLESRNGRAMVNSRAGTVNKEGYIAIRVDGKSFLAHRLAFLFMEGSMPDLDVDHINGCRADNRWSNLRVATKKINAQNIRKATKRNKSGLLGVWVAGNRFRAIIKTDGNVYCLGTYDTAHEAHCAYIKAKRILHEGGTI